MKHGILEDEVRALCRSSGKTGEELKTELGVTYQDMSKWEITRSRPRKAATAYTWNHYNCKNLIR